MPSYVIIGASRGIGYQYLQTLSRNPSNIIIGTARTPSSVQAKVTADALPNVHILQGDLTDAASLSAAATKAAEITGGAVDYLIINGAYLSESTVFLAPTDFIGKEKYFQDEFTTSMNTNVAGALYAINTFLPLVKKSSIKKVTVISSGMGDLDLIVESEVAESVPYAISKAAVNILVAKYAVELKDKGVVFLALSPGVVQTSALNADSKFKYAPHFEGPISPETSVDLQLKVIEGMTLKDSGAFLSHLGTKKWL
ncbi:NAD(P)-binding protein [Lindgomyces ingoldianus]|uniref:NAD(P)-binding protein n=1 Tax=Lindgomyces ingoldianus TaxID=673940 RepID=A0ACB6QUW1_9PLEO|nr:NAD(P)-binding protein [Lindgomyces ingoldianus]KAF2470636.1 NAD(P)-binding protein [Lindgomyces ingoldianus]